MCGRYAAATSQADWVEEFEVAETPERWLEPDYNVCPTKDVLIVRAAGTAEGGEPEFAIARWGLVPSWAKDPDGGARLANARSETVAEKPSYRAAYARRRALLPADGYYEWFTPVSGRKQPFFIHRADGRPLAIAALYETWHAGEPDELLTCTILTTAASPRLEHIHDRMPVLVDRQDWGEWLDPAVPGKELDPGIRARGIALADHLEAYPVSVAVGNVRNNGVGLIVPLPPEGAAPVALDEPTADEGTLF